MMSISIQYLSFVKLLLCPGTVNRNYGWKDISKVIIASSITRINLYKAILLCMFTSFFKQIYEFIVKCNLKLQNHC